MQISLFFGQFDHIILIWDTGRVKFVLSHNHNPVQIHALPPPTNRLCLTITCRCLAIDVKTRYFLQTVPSAKTGSVSDTDNKQQDERFFGHYSATPAY